MQNTTERKDVYSPVMIFYNAGTNGVPMSLKLKKGSKQRGRKHCKAKTKSWESMPGACRGGWLVLLPCSPRAAGGVGPARRSRMLANASFRLSEREVTHGTG
jgi:hypothetical protein